jgi:hypothetical protein
MVDHRKEKRSESLFCASPCTFRTKEIFCNFLYRLEGFLRAAEEWVAWMGWFDRFVYDLYLTFWFLFDFLGILLIFVSSLLFLFIYCQSMLCSLDIYHRSSPCCLLGICLFSGGVGK